jgi:hypothetical protein
MKHELKTKEKTNRKLWIISNYVSNSFDLDVDDRIDITNRDGVLLESININSALIRFYERNEVYGIISAYIWNLDTKSVERYITDLPDNDKKERLRKHSMAKKKALLQKLQDEIKELDISFKRSRPSKESL